MAGLAATSALSALSGGVIGASCWVLLRPGRGKPSFALSRQTVQLLGFTSWSAVSALIGYAVWKWPVSVFENYISKSLVSDMWNPWEYYLSAQSRANFFVAVAEVQGKKDVVVGTVAVEPA